MWQKLFPLIPFLVYSDAFTLIDVVYPNKDQGVYNIQGFA